MNNLAGPPDSPRSAETSRSDFWSGFFYSERMVTPVIIGVEGPCVIVLL